MKARTFLAATAAILLAAFARADVSVTNVVIRQHWPWNGLVDVDYEIVSDDAEATYWVYPEATDNRLGRRVIMNTLSGDGATNAVAAGAHRMVWDAKADNPGFHTTDLAVTMRAVAGAARYLVIDLSGGATAVFYPFRYSTEPPDLSDPACRTTELWLRLVLPGTFTMGSPETTLGRGSDEIQHRVTLTKPYYIGVFEITQRQWELVTGDEVVAQTSSNYGPGKAKTGLSYSAIRGSTQWPQSSDVGSTSFLGKMRAKTNLFWDLPTEAQWEYACRAGTTTDINTGTNLTNTTSDPNMNKAAVCRNGNTDAPSSVGKKLPNAWGLYDMHGNVAEWCRDPYASYTSIPDDIAPVEWYTDPFGWYTGSSFCIRGGCGYANPSACTSAHRFQASSGSSYYLCSPGSSSHLVGFRPVVLPFVN